jgi:hypothetical protein
MGIDLIPVVFPRGWQVRAITWLLLRLILVAVGLWLSGGATGPR